MGDDRNTRYDQGRQKGSHNSYERTEGLYDQAIGAGAQGLSFAEVNPPAP